MTSEHYSLEASPFYRLPSRRKLCDLLYVRPKRLQALMSDTKYRVWKEKSGRLIEEPFDSLKAVHRRVQQLLSRIEHPDWVYSGVCGRSYIDNARQHTGCPFLCSIDIDSFFQSAKKEYVFRFFRYVFRQPEDVAWALSDLLTYREHLPTGSPSSQILAFWAYRPMFEMLRDRVRDSGGIVTVYVDDIAISSERNLADDILKASREVISGFELGINEGKTKRRGREQWKVITGAAISPTGGLDIPNRRRKKIHAYITSLKAGELDESGVRSLQGMLASARQIDPSFHDQLYKYVRYLARLSD